MVTPLWQCLIQLNLSTTSGAVNYDHRGSTIRAGRVRPCVGVLVLEAMPHDDKVMRRITDKCGKPVGRVRPDKLPLDSELPQRSRISPAARSSNRGIPGHRDSGASSPPSAMTLEQLTVRTRAMSGAVSEREPPGP